jgi:prepilin-type N-terminal cleavage/methylation domain-containing protein
LTFHPIGDIIIESIFVSNEYTMKKNSGFTLLEMAIVLVIFGIMAAWSINKFRNTVAHNELEKTANNLYQELRAARALAFKYDTLVFAKFVPSATSTSVCSIYVDKDGDGTRDAAEGECVKVFTIPQPVSIGALSAAKSDAVSDYTLDNNGLGGTWATLLEIDGADVRGEYSHGAVGLKTSRLTNEMYRICITTSMQSIELWKWSGTWRKL